MANDVEVRKALKILASASLRGAPDRETMKDMAELWTRLLKEVNGQVLIQAADDVVITEEFWPTLKRIREAAYQVKVHNFTSAAPNPWKDESRTVFVIPGVSIVTDKGWEAFTIDPGHPRPKKPDIFPLEVQDQLDEIERRTNGIYSKADCQLIHEITEPYLRESKKQTTWAL